MLRLDLRYAKPGMRLAMPVSPPCQPDRALLNAGFELNRGSIDRLHGLGVEHIWVRYPTLDFLSRTIDARLLVAYQDLRVDIASCLRRVAERGPDALEAPRCERAVGRLRKAVEQNANAALFHAGLIDPGGDDLARHSAAVTLLSLLLGLKLENYLVRERRRVTAGQAAEIRGLGLGAMLHDIGVTRLEESVRQRYEQTGRDTDPAWREHPSIGYRMVHGRVDPAAATIVLHHHQRQDGSGFSGSGRPALEGGRTHVFSRIVGAADQLDRLRTRSGGAAVPMACALSCLYRPHMLRQFDHEVLRAMVALVPPYPPGALLRLNDERWGVCVGQNPAEPCRPMVRIIPGPTDLPTANLPESETVDLGFGPGLPLRVVECDGQAVGDWNFDLPGHLRPIPAAA